MALTVTVFNSNRVKSTKQIHFIESQIAVTQSSPNSFCKRPLLLSERPSQLLNLASPLPRPVNHPIDHLNPHCPVHKPVTCLLVNSKHVLPPRLCLHGERERG